MPASPRRSARRQSRPVRCSTSSMPLIPGIHRSVRITPGCSRFRISSAAAPESAETYSTPSRFSIAPRIFRFIATSSTSSARPEQQTGTALSGSFSETGSGLRSLNSIPFRWMENTVPLPASLSTSMEPPMRSTSRCEITRPRPVPSASRLRCCLNGTNSSRTSCGDIPGPVSRTASRRFPRPGPAAVKSAKSVTPPERVNLKALPRIFTITCRNRLRSNFTNSGNSGESSSRNVRFLLRADGMKILPIPSRNSARSRNSGTISIFSASSLERSSTSLTSSSSEVPAL